MSVHRTWIQDVFRAVYSSDAAPVDEEAKAGGFRTTELDILNFINAQFAESDAESDASSLYMQPHFKLPVIDVDIQQPVCFNPGLLPPDSNPASKVDGKMDSQQREQVSRLENLETVYPETVNKCRTLDRYIHESITGLDLNSRNGNQVVSRFVLYEEWHSWVL
ncbi:uncharacterized protein C8A04DRAFT_31702 [Dichotomopilus funicola]|uniref:Uncharacterized protein n=1 Tax=Dichotomopilus funicola TaxID=1934379 RepID=A0AAN6UXA0_9PEZI|nr:hypothetical protein C8A04DRAFT_31702 [Dichotomopilus funicola]